jgi:Fic family protein
VYVAPPPDYEQLLVGLAGNGDRLLQVVRAPVPENGSGYVHWDKLRHLEPPGDLTHEEWWFSVKWARQHLLRTFPLTDSDGNYFSYGMPDAVQRSFHQIDQRCSGEIAMPEVVTADDQARQHFLVNSLMEEAIRSSQLEGATTSRRVAKDLLRSGRPPKDRSERMILNNYRALQFMREVGTELVPNTVLELHRIVTEGTLDDPSAAGRLQTPDEERVGVFDRETDRLLHKPPPAEQLPARLEALCAFANEDNNSERFIHPVVRAILLHFWLAYDHPFEDGNGRTARALFYWYMRTRGYWLVEYLSVSRILADAPAKYAKAFLLTETDSRDTTYFIIFQQQVIERAIAELHDYLDRKVREIRDVERLMKAGSAGFNHRQLALLSHALRNPDQVYTFQSHASSHTVTHETARNDLLPLVEKGLLERRRAGRKHLFIPSPNLGERLRKAH